MHILLIEPYYGGSHKSWADSYQQHSSHNVTLLTLPAQFWKWRMQGGAVALARLASKLDTKPDIILVSDMVNLAILRALTHRIWPHTPVALYFHESQLTYPQNSRQKHGWRYGFINYISALTADHVYFNSQYHLDVFFSTLPNMLKHFGDYNELQTVDEIYRKSSVLWLGIDLQRLTSYQPTVRKPSQPPLLIWNHRWEEEKNPQGLFNTLYRLQKNNINFQVALVGENTRQSIPEFEQAKKRLGTQLVQYGYLSSFAEYAQLLWKADYVISTAYQEFFGAAIAEAIYCDCVPLLPNRLNYPYLMPAKYHADCLYKGESLFYLLRKHLTESPDIDRTIMKEHITQFDWSNMAPVYDTALAALL